MVDKSHCLHLVYVCKTLKIHLVRRPMILIWQELYLDSSVIVILEIKFKIFHSIKQNWNPNRSFLIKMIDICCAVHFFTSDFSLNIHANTDSVFFI